ncbi:YjbF family lipoprotein [Antarctobacter heliothermus]|uniref:Group 4 capsule polysaccharide lipoprotein gfcB, YjbF n=1 Tax=Antarctobacter heliothermus TaxID=74033 RepID=A0A239BTN2_9RHOB|nr:YjbF family lipoprotein [Antarctobacter heliothermus]SNS10778.1 Group 4 capsule polysaccharide lipoprotein gfcB, YjbF [Antarctobacter heliothermus]
MTLRSFTRIGLALTAALALVSCGTANQDTSAFMRQIPKSLFAKKTQPKPLTTQQIAQALGATTGSVFLFEIEARKSQTLLQDIQRNGPYQTYGNASRQVVVLRDGMVISTRGLAGDLMSSEEDQLLHRVQARSEGRASYDLRFLTPEDVTIVRRYSCYTTTGATVPVAGGLVQTSGQVVTAKCTAADGVSPDFTNTYVVGGDGYILSGRQWAGPYLGYLVSQVLRR